MIYRKISKSGKNPEKIRKKSGKNPVGKQGTSFRIYVQFFSSKQATRAKGVGRK